MTINPEMLGEVAAECLEELQTTSVDGRSYVSIQDMMDLVASNAQAIVEVSEGHLQNPAITDMQVYTLQQRVEGMATILAQFATVLDALEAKEGIESLCPGDFL
jgi:hypothetical protein